MWFFSFYSLVTSCFACHLYISCKSCTCLSLCKLGHLLSSCLGHWFCMLFKLGSCISKRVRLVGEKESILISLLPDARLRDSEYYPSKTLHLILCGILQHMRSINPGCVNFLDKKDVRFKSIHGVMDAHFHQLHSTGIGRDVKHARALTTDDEEKLWRNGVMGTKTPKLFKMLPFSLLERCFAFVVALNLEN